MTDPIADMLTRFRNGLASGQAEVELPHSDLKERLAKILASGGFLADTKVAKAEVGKSLILVLNDAPIGQISEIKRLSSPGRRRYAKAGQIPLIKRGRGLVIVSTSQGLMSGEQARKKKLGGELIASIY